MRTFEEVWKGTGYNYGEDELESVKLGWELALAEVKLNLMIETPLQKSFREKMERIEGYHSVLTRSIC